MNLEHLEQFILHILHFFVNTRVLRTPKIIYLLNFMCEYVLSLPQMNPVVNKLPIAKMK